MYYSDGLEESYQKDYQERESLSWWSTNTIARTMMVNFDTNNSLQIFHDNSGTQDETTFWEFEDESPGFKINEEANRAYCRLNSERVYPFLALQQKIKDNHYSNTEPLPSCFYFALEHQAIKKNSGDKQTKYTQLKEDMKTFGDLPQEFIEGIKSGTIEITPIEDDKLKKEGFSNNIALICKSLPKRPLLILIYGRHLNHSASYIARISEDNHCELLSLNSLDDYNDSLFIESLKEGLKKGLELSDDDFDDPIYEFTYQKNTNSCSIITPAVLSQVDPDRPLSEQVQELKNVMEGVINNNKMIRRLFARIDWWNAVVNSKKVREEGENGGFRIIERDTEELEQAMHEVFKQLFYYVCKLPIPTKIDLNNDPQILTASLKFLNIFDINPNDKVFLKLFNRVDSKLVSEISDLNPQHLRPYSSDSQKKYSEQYQNIEKKNTWLNAGNVQRVIEHLNTSETLHCFHLHGGLVDEPTFAEFDSDELYGEYSKKPTINENANLAFYELNAERVYPFIEFKNKIQEGLYDDNDPLPLCYYVALKHKAFKNINGTKKSTYKKLNKSLQTFGDLPKDFIEGIKSGDITIEPVEDDRLKKEGFANCTASICRAMPKRPLTLVVMGHFPGHYASYIAQISEDDQCEIVSLNSLPGYNNDLFIDSLKEGIKKGLGLKDEDFLPTQSSVINQFDSASCAVIVGAVLSSVDPTKTLAEQFDNFVDVMNGVIKHKTEVRKLFARMEWWNQWIALRRKTNSHGHLLGAREVFTKEQLHIFQSVFKQLFYHVCGLKSPKKITLPKDPVIFKECARFLMLFDITINDPVFLRHFNKVSQNTQDEVSDEISDETLELNKNFFERDHWADNKTQLLEKLFEHEDLSESSKIAFEKAIDDLAKHARLNLNSKFTTKRALAGQKKYQALSTLFQESETLEDLQKNTRKLLDTKNPDKSTLLKNRGGFFGAYKTFSCAASFFGAKHYKFGNRTAISRTDHYLIALSDVIDKIISTKSDDQSDLSTSISS